VAVFDRTPRAPPRSRCGAGRDAPLRRREAQRSWPRAQRASTSDLAHLSERSAQRVASYAPGQDREHRRVVGVADRLSEASRPAPRRLRLHRSDACRADVEVQLCAESGRTFLYLCLRIRMARRERPGPVPGPATAAFRARPGGR
jgi:hypothetical protein